RSFTFIIMVCITIMVLTIFSFFSESRFIFIALKIVILLLSVPIIYGFIKSIGEGVIDFLFTFISAIPWLLFELINNSFIFTHTGLTYTQSYALFLGKLSSLFFFILTFLYLNKRQYENAVDTAKAELKKSEEESHNIVSNVTELKGILINDLKYKLRQPVDSIISLVLILENAYKTPELLSITKVLAKEANGLKQEIEQGLLDYQSEVDNVVDSLNVNIEQLTSINTPWIDVSICIFDHNHVNSSHNALMLRSYGYKVSIIEEQYQILSAINDGKVDILIIDPSSTGERAFSLCSLIRSEYSLLDLPILMVTDYHRDFMMKKGFGAGVNDFLTKPFDFSEIVARIQSLIKLKNIAANNYDLAKSEKEKNTFLYFLTHNLNTPLTIMINRVNQLVQLDAPDVDKDLVEDLSASTLEMYDIVQNVLIAFRLSDGRQTVRFSELNLINIMNDLSKGLYKKAFEKQQHLYIDMPESVPMVYGDLSAVKGIIYNLVDNSLKFSPVGGKIYIKFIVGDNVVLEIIDNGPGIKEEEQALLFGRFQKLSTRPSAGESSTGLGLYVARELARLNGGDVLYESGHEGACFIFKLPLSDEALNG
ncbi:MAG: ATP-binding protein, partial [Spirochaetales bacterium]|nr:ATP-binding protein [Spirochaetales bacterium]